MFSKKKEVMVYFDVEEIPYLETLKKDQKRDASSAIRWIVEMYGKGLLFTPEQMTQHFKIFVRTTQEQAKLGNSIVEQMGPNYLEGTFQKDLVDKKVD